MNRKEILALPISITGWILLREYVRECADVEAYQKLVSEYQNDCPLYEMEKIMITASSAFDEEDFDMIVRALFDAYHMK